MNINRRIVIILVTVVLAVIGALSVWSQREPSYQGKSLSRWLEYGYHEGMGEIGAPEQANAVVRKFGKKAIPALLRLLQKKNNEYRYYGVRGFQSLGTEAKGALPKVQRLFYDTNFTDAATSVLMAIAPVESLQIFHAGLTNQEESIRANSAWGLGSFGSNAVVAVPGLLVCLKDRSSRVRQEAATALGKIGQEGAIVIPALVETIHDPNHRVQIFAVMAIGAFGSQATAAVPDIRKAMSETNSQHIQWAASNALQAIKPAALEKAGGK